MCKKLYLFALICVLHCDKEISSSGSTIIHEGNKQRSNTEPTTNDSTKDKKCKDTGMECNTDNQCCDKVCQLEAQHNDSEPNLTSYCVPKSSGPKQCRNRACLHTLPSDPFLTLDLRHPQSCTNPRNFPSLYEECKEFGGKVVAKPGFAYCYCPQMENNNENLTIYHTVRTNLPYLTSGKYAVETLHNKSQTYGMGETVTRVPKLFNSTEKVKQDEAENSNDLNEKARRKNHLLHHGKDKSFAQIGAFLAESPGTVKSYLGQSVNEKMPHSSRVIWDPEKYINLEYNEKGTAVDLKNTDDAIMKSDKKVKKFSSLGHTIKTVNKKIKAEKVKQEPTEELDVIPIAERVEDEEKGPKSHLKSFFPKHFE